MAGLTERLTDRGAKRRAAREERRKRLAMDPRTGPAERRLGAEYGMYAPRGVLGASSAPALRPLTVRLDVRTPSTIK
jgi:hypothetical protein